MRILSAVHPTSFQKQVICRIAAATTPMTAASYVSAGANMVAARNMLMKLGLIEFGSSGATLTDRGTQVAQDEGLIDASGNLTPSGQQLAGMATSQSTPQDQLDDPGLDDLNVESFSLLKQLLR